MKTENQKTALSAKEIQENIYGKKWVVDKESDYQLWISPDEHSITIAKITQAEDRNGIIQLDDDDIANSQAIVNAVNSTYLSGLDPLAYGECVEALKKLLEEDQKVVAAKSPHSAQTIKSAITALNKAIIK